MNNIKRKSAGFSLIELMVVIVIIGILAVLGLSSFQNALKRSRDARRIGDIKDIAQAQEQVKAINGSYVTASANNPCAFTGGVGELSTPTDPSNLNYICYSSATAFCVSAELEQQNNGNCTGCQPGMSFSSSPGSNNHYCVKSKQ